MCACTVASCRSNRDDSDDEEERDEEGRATRGPPRAGSWCGARSGANEGRRRPKPVILTSTRTVVECRHYHTPNVFSPPPSFFDKLKSSLFQTYNEAYTFWRWLRYDRFRWELFKSVLMFTMGLKMLNDIYRHMSKTNDRDIFGNSRYNKEDSSGYNTEGSSRYNNDGSYRYNKDGCSRYNSSCKTGSGAGMGNYSARRCSYIRK